MTPEPDDRGGATGDVGRDGGLDRAYRETAAESPPAHLDAAILAAARREAGARPRPAPSALRRWRVPVSIAVVVVLSASLVILVSEEGGDQLIVPDVPAPPPPTRPYKAATEPKPHAAPAAPAERTAPSPDEQARERIAAARESVEAHKPEERARPRDEREREVPQSPPSARHEQPSAPVGVLSGPQPFPAIPGRGNGEPSLPAPRTASSPSELADAASGRRGTSEDRDGSPARPAPEEFAKQAGTPPPKLATRAQSSGAPAAAGARTAAPVPGSAGRAEDVPAMSPRVARLVEALGVEPPEKWLARIRELRRDGQTAEADALLAEFRRRYPYQAVPPELR